MEAGLTRKERDLHQILSECGSLLVACSGGVDSIFLAHEALGVLGPSRALAVTGVSPSVAGRQRAMAARVAADFEIPWREVPTGEMGDGRYRANTGERCYFCKSELYGRLSELADRWGYRRVADGANADDASDHRPGARAAREAGVLSPLQAAGLTKSEIRRLSRRAGLPTWDAPASPCLASRLPYGVEVTARRLRQVEAAEEALRAHGLRGDLRVRHHAGAARLELDPAGLARWSDPELCRRTAERMEEIGFDRALLDLEGYASGSLNRALPQADVASRPAP